MAFTDNFKQFISKQIDDAVELIFINAHGYVSSTSGDITPEQVLKLDDIKEDLRQLIETQVIQNLTEEQLKSYGIPSDLVPETNTPQERISFIEKIIQNIDSKQQSGVDTPNEQWFSDEHFDVLRKFT